MDFSIMFWGDVRDNTTPSTAYDLLLRTAKYADEQGYSALWIPERHFDPWGGLFPNPSVVCAHGDRGPSVQPDDLPRQRTSA